MMGRAVIGIVALAFVCLPGVYAGSNANEAKSKALAQYIVAVINDLNGKPKEAADGFERSIALDSSQYLPHLRLAAWYTRAGMLEQSVKHLKIVLNLAPQNSQAHYLLALVYSSQKKYDLASKEYEHILNIGSKNDPNNLEIYIYLAQLYFSQEKYPQAIEQFNRILEIQPDNVSANYFLGSSYLETGKRAQARKLFQKVLSLDPGHDEALNSLAYMYAEESANLDEAIKMARRAVGISPFNGAYYDTLGWGLFKKGMNAEALMALQKATGYVQSPIVYDHMGDVYKAVKEFALARKFWRKSLDFDANQPQVKAKIEESDNIQAFKE